MTWGAAEWGAVASAVAAVATAGAGYMALVAANRTIKATRDAADENSKLLREQIDVQRQELSELTSRAVEAERREKLFAAYSIFKLAGEVQNAISVAISNPHGEGAIIPQFANDLPRRVETAYPLQSFLSRENHISFQFLDALVHGEPLRNKEHALNAIDRLNALRLALTPAIVGLPRGSGDRVYGSDGVSALVAASDAEI